jgi:hypothetical protein
MKLEGVFLLSFFVPHVYYVLSVGVSISGTNILPYFNRYLVIS